MEIKLATVHSFQPAGSSIQHISTRIFVLMQLSALLLFLLILSACNEMEKETSRRKENSVVVNDSSFTMDTAKEMTAPVERDSARLTPTERKIRDIRRQYDRINSLTLSRQSFGFECDVKDKVTYYLYQGRIVKIVINWGFLGDGKSLHEYYYKDNKVFFVYKKHRGYGPGPGETIFEQRSYFDADKNIRYVENQRVTKCVDCSPGQNSREYKALRAFKTKDFKGALCAL